MARSVATAWLLLGLGAAGCGGDAGVDRGLPEDARAAIDAEISGDAGVLGDSGAIEVDSGELDGGAPVDAAPPDLGSTDLRVDDGGVDGGPPADAGAPPDLGPAPDGGQALPDSGPLPRGLDWVRTNPTFVSGLVVAMGPPPAEFVRAYYQDFHATAAHLWATGMPAEATAWGAVGPPGGRFVSWLDSDGNSAANPAAGVLGGGPAAMPGRIGYQVGDEPGLACDGNLQCAIDDLNRMGAGLDAVRAADPNALIFLNFADLDVTPALLNAYAALDADVVSYDAYHRGAQAYEALEMVRAAGLAQGRPYWRYMRSFGYDSGSAGVTASDARWDAYSGLLYGYTGHSWFLYTINASAELNPLLFTAENDFNAARTPLYDQVAAVNQVLNRLGPIVTQLTSTGVRYRPALPLLQPPGTQDWSIGAGGDPYLSDLSVSGVGVDAALGFFVDPYGDPVVMAQNVSHTHGTFPTSHENVGTITLTFDFSAAPPGVNTTAVRSVDLSTGLSTTLPLSVVDATHSTLVLSLQAGDLAVFKVDNGRDFVRGPGG